MDGEQPQKTNNLVGQTRMAGIAAKASDMKKLRECARAIGGAGGSSTASTSRASLGNLPSQLPHLTRKAGNQGTPARGIHQDRPPQSHGR